MRSLPSVVYSRVPRPAAPLWTVHLAGPHAVVCLGLCYLATPSWCALVPLAEMGHSVSLQSTPHTLLLSGHLTLACCSWTRRAGGAAWAPPPQPRSLAIGEGLGSGRSGEARRGCRLCFCLGSSLSQAPWCSRGWGGRARASLATTGAAGRGWQCWASSACAWHIPGGGEQRPPPFHGEQERRPGPPAGAQKRGTFPSCNCQSGPGSCGALWSGRTNPQRSKEDCGVKKQKKPNTRNPFTL